MTVTTVPETTDKTQPPEAEQPRDWYFTFGSGHTHPETGENLGLAYVVIHDTCDGSRERMWAGFANRWAFQYPRADCVPGGHSVGDHTILGGCAGVETYNLHEVELPAACRAEVA